MITQALYSKNLIYWNLLTLYNFITQYLYLTIIPINYHPFLIIISNIHHYNTQLASKSSYSLPKIRTNYGKFSLKFQGALIWNKIPDNFKTLRINSVKKKLKIYYTANYWQYLLYIISVLKKCFSLLTLCRTLFVYFLCTF